MAPEENILASLSTKGIDGDPMSAIAIAFVAGMGLMSVTIMLGLHTFIAMAALIGGISFVFGLKGGNMTYRLTENGIYRTYKPFLARWFFEKTERNDLFVFSEIRSYKLSKDLNRSGKEVETLRINLYKTPFVIVINDEVNPLDFRDFCDAFIIEIEQRNDEIAESRHAMRPGEKTPERPITRKKGFYQTIWAKLVTLLFLLIAIGIVILYFMDILKWGHLLELIILIPGILYMYNRSFIKNS